MYHQHRGACVFVCTSWPTYPVVGIETRSADHYLIGHLERLPLGTSYPDLVRRVAAVEQGVFKRTGGWPRTYVDATGVGQPVVEMLDRACKGRIVAVYFTHGDRRVVEGSDVGAGYGVSGRAVKLGKAWLVSRLQVLLQTRRLHLPNTDEARALAQELQVYEIRVDENANDRYGAFKVGAHDDLVTALGLSVQEMPSQGIYF